MREVYLVYYLYSHFSNCSFFLLVNYGAGGPARKSLLRSVYTYCTVQSTKVVNSKATRRSLTAMFVLHISPSLRVMEPTDRDVNDGIAISYPR